MRRVLALMCICSVVLFTQGGLSAHEATRKAKLRGGKEVPGPGDPNGKGKARIDVDDEEGRVCFRVKFRKIGDTTAAHIHRGEAGEAGPVVVPLWEGDEESPATGCVEVANDLAEEIQKNPKQFYVNVHSEDYPDGAIRGNLKKPNN